MRGDVRRVSDDYSRAPTGASRGFERRAPAKALFQAFGLRSGRGLRGPRWCRSFAGAGAQPESETNPPRQRGRPLLTSTRRSRQRGPLGDYRVFFGDERIAWITGFTSIENVSPMFPV